MTKTATVTLINETQAIVSGLDKTQYKALYEKFAVFKNGFQHTPRYKLGHWDGRIGFFSKQGHTYIQMLDRVLPAVTALGYKIKIVDERDAAAFVQPEPITDQVFSHVNHPDTGEPIILHDYQVRVVNACITTGAGMVIAATSAGKAQPNYVHVRIPGGTKAIGNIQPGDSVVDPNGGVSKVLKTFKQTAIPVYNFVFDSGLTIVEACPDHLWKVQTNAPVSHIIDAHESVDSIRYPMTPDGWFVFNTLVIKQLIDTGFRVSVPRAPVPIYEPKIDLIAKPSTVGKNLPTLEYIQPAYKIAQQTDRFEIVRQLWAYHNNCVRVKKQVAADLIDIANSICGTVAVIPTENDHYIISSPIIADTFEEYLANAKRLTTLRPIEAVVETSKVEDSTCMLLDSEDHTYFTTGGVITHNTFMCAALVHAFDKTAPWIKTITIVPDGNLIRQTKADYALVGLDVGEYSGTEKSLEHQHIVSTWQSIQHNPQIMATFHLVIVDEAHGLRGRVLQDIVVNHSSHIAHRFGFTGTLPKDEVDAQTVLVSIGNILETVKARELIDRGILADLHVDIYQLTEDFKADYAAYKRDLPSTIKAMTYIQWLKRYFPDYDAETAYLATADKRLQWIANKIISAQHQGNVLALVDSKAQGWALQALIPGAIFVNGTDVKKIEDRQKIYDLFKTRNDLVVLATVHIAGTGLSIRRIYNLFLIDLGKSFTRIIQSIGRGLRTASDKSSVCIHDICSNLRYSAEHLAVREAYYSEAEYPYTRHKVTY